MKSACTAIILLSPLSMFTIFAEQNAAPADPNTSIAESNKMCETDYFPRNIVTGPKAWAVACCALLVEYNRGWHDILPTQPIKPSSVQSLKRSLDKWWGINNKADLMRNLYLLEIGGHRAHFQKLGRQLQNLNADEFSQLLQKTKDQEHLNELCIAREYYPKFGKKSLVGWDFERAIYLCRAGYECGYISENEAWYRIMNYAQYLQQTFDSWEDLGRNYIIGRKFWSYKYTLDSGQYFDDTFILLTEAPSSPWNTLDWNMDLLNSEASDDK
jgi:hypothetical protein